MFGVKAKITKCVDDESYSSIVQCEFFDAKNERQIFHDKDATYTTENLDRDSKYPLDGIIGCEIIEEKNLAGREIVKIFTGLPWHIESVKGETVFEVLKEQIIEFQHLGE